MDRLSTVKRILAYYFGDEDAATVVALLMEECQEVASKESADVEKQLHEHMRNAHGEEI